jgi:hypothetical protein
MTKLKVPSIIFKKIAAAEPKCLEKDADKYQDKQLLPAANINWMILNE